MGSFREAIQSDTPVLVDFSAEWCGPCKMLAPILHEVKTMMGDAVKIIKIDIDKNPAVSQELQIQSVPTLMIYRNGQLKWRQSGVIPAKQIQHALQQYSK